MEAPRPPAPPTGERSDDGGAFARAEPGGETGERAPEVIEDARRRAPARAPTVPRRAHRTR